MSLYEILAVVALAGAGGFAWFLYRKDTRATRTGDGSPPPASGEAMFSRRPRPPSGPPPDVSP